MKKQSLTEEQLRLLNESYPVSEEEVRTSHPRFGMLSKDLIEESGVGKNKKIKVVESAGTFYTEKDEGEVDETTGKKVWTRKYLEGETADVIICFHRYQLRKFDKGLNKFISSAVYDTPDQNLQLYLDKQIIKSGNEAFLKSCYPALSAKGNPTSDLKKEVILFVLYEGELYQANISQSSKWEFMSYKRTVNPSTVITTIGSIDETNGSNTYRKMTFKNKRMIDGDEFETVIESQTILRQSVESDKKRLVASAEDKSYEALTDGK